MTAEDVPGLVALCRDHAAFEKARWEEYDRSTALEALFIDSTDAWCWVVDGEDGTLVGFASAFLERSTWTAKRYLHMDCLYLRENARGSGLGQVLVREVARTAMEAGVSEVQWQTPAWNDRARRFYGRLGATSKEKYRFTLDAAEISHPGENES